tara:strand:+ start:40 stop:984 length:945 start_codon:yes stop_codon:yes gene_type:complete
MTTYYKGNNIGLNYDAATGTWSFTNQPQDFIDPNSFSTTDQDFVYAPPDTVDPDTPEQDPCPPGYIYDTELKQCVPDPNYQAPDFLGQTQYYNEPQEADPFISFDASSAEGRKFMYDHAMDKGYINSKGQLLGPPKAPNIGFMTPVAQFGITRQYNRWLKELGQYDASMKAQGLPTGFVQAINMAPTLLETFYDPEGSTKLRDVSTEPITPITDDQITETKAGEPVDIISDIRDSKSGTSYTDSSGDTYTSTGDGGVKFEPKVSKPTVQRTYQPTKNYQGSTTYGTRGASASAQKQMKQMDTRKTQSGPNLRDR